MSARGETLPFDKTALMISKISVKISAEAAEREKACRPSARETQKPEIAPPIMNDKSEAVPTKEVGFCPLKRIREPISIQAAKTAACVSVASKRVTDVCLAPSFFLFFIKIASE